jgi:hypothetical protein
MISQRRRCSSAAPSTTFDVRVQDLTQQWETLSTELNSFEQKHRIYLSKLEEVEKLKKDHRIEFNHIQKKVDNLNKLIDLHQTSQVVSDDERTLKTIDKPKLSRTRRESVKKAETSEEPRIRLQKIHEDLITQRANYLKRITYTLPQPSERYLRIILGGDLPVSILDKSDQWRYKESYERFKLRVTLVIMIVSLLMCTILPVNRALDALFHFLLVWYYCTLTIRESILAVNGTKIQLWWRLHHFISTACACIVLLWPSAKSYQLFRQQHYIFNLYISFVQVLLYYYQRGLLYRLRALGYSDELQITIEGFQSWMLRGLTFLAPFLFFGYLFQLYNAFVLYYLSITPSAEPNSDWRIVLKILAVIFLTLFLGNFITMLMVIRRKIRERIPDIQWLQHRYESFKTLLLSHVRSAQPFYR